MHAISELYKLEADGKYKYISEVHDCVSLLTDIYKDAGFAGHFSEYVTETELFKDIKELAPTAYLHREHYAGKEFTIPHRNDVREYMKLVHGDDYAIKWDEIRHKNINVHDRI